MTTIAPGLHAVELFQAKRRSNRSRSAQAPVQTKKVIVDVIVESDDGDAFESDESDIEADAFYADDDDPTEYPAGEPMSRDLVETYVATKLQAVIERYQASRGIVCFTGSDNFLYWHKGDNKRSVSPDVYILPGLPPDADPRNFARSKFEGCWKTWVHDVAPSLAVEVKAWRNPRKDELQSPLRHDALGTRELIVFDPFLIKRRRKARKRFVVYRRDDAGKLMPVLHTNDRRVYSEVLEAFLVAEGDNQSSRLRIGVGPTGETLLPFDSELIEMTSRRAEEEARMRVELAQRVEDETRRADEEARRRQEETRRAEEAIRRAAELEAELTRLRTGGGKQRKR
ncbi:MAG: hypothetical protein IPM54_35370 [Polyangiaceae bacterium]|nr:hypothetical protein [Polyangiaceae bacterium]